MPVVIWTAGSAWMGDSSGGWTSVMAAVTGDAPELESTVGTTGVSSAVQASVAFYPPADFLTMDAWALRKCAPQSCHDGENSPESRLVGCAIQTCPEKVKAANPTTYVTPADPPIMILPGNSDQLAPHGNWNGFLSSDALREAATMRSTSGRRVPGGESGSATSASGGRTRARA